MSRAAYLFCLIFALLLEPLSVRLEAESADRIQKIHVLGNDKTRSETIVEISRLRVGDFIDDKKLVESCRRIESSSLFESVNCQNNEGQSSQSRIVSIQVQEKISWFVFPIFRLSKDSYGGGLGAGESNLFGRNKKVLFFGDYGSLNRRFFMTYRDPQFLHENWALILDPLARWEEVSEFKERKALRKVRVLEYGSNFYPGYKITPHWTLYFGAHLRKVGLDLEEDSIQLRSVELDEGIDFSPTLQLVWDQTYEKEGLFSGMKSYDQLQVANKKFGSFNYLRNIFEVSAFSFVFNSRVHSTTKSSFQIGENLPFYREFTSGGENLRGFLEREFRGDTKATFKEELLIPLYTHSWFIIRNDIFWDSHLLWFRNEEDLSRDHWHNGLGTGLRVHLKKIVVPVFGFDVAYAVEDQSWGFQLSLGIVPL